MCWTYGRQQLGHRPKEKPVCVPPLLEEGGGCLPREAQACKGCWLPMGGDVACGFIEMARTRTLCPSLRSGHDVCARTGHT